MSNRIFHALTVLVLCTGIATCKKSDNSANGPTGPSGTNTITGGWIGTLARPNGLAPIALRWDVTVTPVNGVDTLKGTITMTGPSGTATATGEGVPAGNDSSGYNIHMSFREATPASNCKVLGSTKAAGSGDAYPSPYRTITVPAFTISYVADCRGLFDGATQQTNVEETAQLTLTKQ